MERSKSLVLLGRTKNTQGFTLAELLLALAIVLILAALAAPSISNIQRTMRMAQLDAAASDIAVAAQHQMTSMKVSGTWLELFDGSSPKLPTANQAAKVDGSQSNNGDIYYMTADQARSSGVLPAGSIDNVVCDSDYIIEYSISTATITGVFYTDGKTGFFQKPPENIQVTKPADEYYKKMSAATGRTQADRIKADPMIGYYSGTPAGATNEVALANPAIWINDEGKLCIQDPNLSKHPNWNTNLDMLVENQENGATATISGVQGGANATTFMVGINEEEQNPFPNNGSTSFFTLVNRDNPDDTGVGADVYVFDFEVFKSSEDENLKKFAELFTSGDPVKVTATVKTGQKPYIPATASAYIDWPESVALLSVLVTNPAAPEPEGAFGTLPSANPADQAEEDDKERYRSPEVIVTDSSDTPSDVIVGSAAKESYEIFSTEEKLRKENSEAAFQRYTGKKIGLAQAVSTEAKLRATVGSYTPSGGDQHEYQIYELWMSIGEGGPSRIGYLRNNEWVWVGDLGMAFSSCVTGIVAGKDTKDTASISISPSAMLYALEGYRASEEDGFTIYVRTTPKLDEVRKFFTGHEDAEGGIGGDFIESVITDMESNMVTSSRGKNKGSSFRAAFESEFGSSSAVASWTIARKTISGQTGFDGRAFPEDNRDIRIYYSVTPAFGFNAALDAPDNEPTNVAMWYVFRDYDNGRRGWVYPQAMLTERSDVTSGGDFFMTSTSDNTGFLGDFEFNYERDYLFYRVLKYYDENGKALTKTDPLYTLNVQYVPYSHMDDKDVASLRSLENHTENNQVTEIFVGWSTTDTITGEELVIPGGGLLSDYDSQLKSVGITLNAKYVKVGIGLMYLEFGENGEVGYSGYFASAQEKKEVLLGEQVGIESWGYYVIMPHGMVAQGQTVTIAGIQNYDGSKKVFKEPTATYEINGALFDAYRIDTEFGDAKKIVQGEGENRIPYATPSITVTEGNKTLFSEADFMMNPNFACAVETNSVTAKKWGTENSPWLIRHATQFIGALKYYGTPIIQSAYADQAFAQMHDIDMADASGAKFNTIFKGKYDGQGFKIVVSYAQYAEVAGNGYSVPIPDANAQAQGLFPVANNAQISGVHLVVPDSLTSIPGSRAGNVKFGLLVGAAINTSIKECSVTGSDETNAGEMQTVGLAITQDSNGVIGVAIGYGNGAAIDGISVSDLSLAIEGRSDWGGNKNVYLGGLAGFIENSPENIQNCSVTNAEVVLEKQTQIPTNGELDFGGIAGLLTATNIDNCSVSNVSLKTGDGKALLLKNKSRLNAGGVVGRATQSNVTSCTVAYAEAPNEQAVVSLPAVAQKAGTDGSARYGGVAGYISPANIHRCTVKKVAFEIVSIIEITNQNAVAIGGFAGGVSEGSESGSNVQQNTISEVTIAFTEGQIVDGYLFGWAAGRNGSMSQVNANDQSPQGSVTYAIGSGSPVIIQQEFGEMA